MLLLDRVISNINTFLLVKDLFPKEIFKRIKTLGFGHFLNDVEVVINPFHLDDIVGRYIGDHKFCLKNKILEMKVRDIGNILGIPSFGIMICNEKKDEINYWTLFYEKYFANKLGTRYIICSHV